MIITNTKRLRELKKENDELKTTLQKFSGKHESITQLDDMLRKIRFEIAELQNQKATYHSTIQKLKDMEIEVQKDVEKLNKEVEHLRELKTVEQNNVLVLTEQLGELNGLNEQGNGKSETKISLPAMLEKDIKDAERKKNELQRENGELENKLKYLYKRTVELTSREQNLIQSIEEKSKQLDTIESYRLIDANAELIEIEKKITETREIERKSTADFQQRINKLVEQEKELQGKVTSCLRKLEEAEEKLVMKSSPQHEEAENKMLALVVEEQKLKDSIEAKRKKIDELNMTISSIEEEQKNLVDSANAFRIDSSEVSLQQITHSRVRQLQEEANNLKDYINQLKMTEELKRELISKLKDELSSKEIEFAALENDFDTKSNQLKELSIKNQGLAEEINFQNKKLSKICETITGKHSQLNDQEAKMKQLEERIHQLNNEITQREILKTDTEKQILREKETVKRLEDRQKGLRINISSLETEQKQIEDNNKVFEKRFSQLFEQYNKEINEMNRRRNVLENMLQKKEKDIKEHDDTILEKLAILDETEKVLLIRQVEIDSFDDLLKLINEQKELLKKDLINLDEKAIERKIQNQELRIESDVLQKKITEFEKSLLEVINSADDRFKRSIEKREKLNNEIREYEIRLKELNTNMKDSMNELVDLQTAIGNIKVEHEEHRIEINKLISLRNKLHDEISKNQIILDKYKKIKERIRQEQEMIKKRREERLKAEIGSIYLQPESTKREDLSKMFKL